MTSCAIRLAPRFVSRGSWQWGLYYKHVNVKMSTTLSTDGLLEGPHTHTKHLVLLRLHNWEDFLCQWNTTLWQEEKSLTKENKPLKEFKWVSKYGALMAIWLWFSRWTADWCSLNFWKLLKNLPWSEIHLKLLNLLRGDL